MSRTEFVETIAGFSGRAFRKGRKRKPKAASQERDEGRPKQRYKVRCALTYAFYMDVDAHDSDEAELVAEQYCREQDAKSDVDFWDSESSYQHSCFEAEETT